MFKQFDYKILVGILFIGVLIVVGTYVYTQRSYDSFLSEIDESPKFTKSLVSNSEKEVVTSSKQPATPQQTKSINKNKLVGQKPIVKTESDISKEEKAVSGEKTAKSEFDAASLLSAFGIPNEVQSALNEDATEEDLEKAQSHRKGTITHRRKIWRFTRSQSNN